MQAWTPALAKRYMASELRRLRLAAGISQTEVAAQLKDSRTRVSELEVGTTVPKEDDFKILLPLYGAPDRVTELVALLPVAKKRNWWVSVPTVPKGFGKYLGLEEGAQRIDIWNGLTIPDLLQTREYATAQLNEALPGALATDIADQVELRMRRQQVWRDRGGYRARLRVILSETALQPRDGLTTVMSDQYDRLLELAASDVELHVLPLTAGPPASPFSPFSLLHLDIPADPGVLYIESPAGGHYSEDPETLNRTTLLFGTLWSKALNRTDSLNFLKSCKENLKPHLG